MEKHLPCEGCMGGGRKRIVLLLFLKDREKRIMALWEERGMQLTKKEEILSMVKEFY